MRRFPLIFTTVVWTAFVTLFLVRRGATADPYEGLEFGRLATEPLPALETPRGPHVLTGVVLADLDSPADDVLVELEGIEPALPASPWSARTDSDGRFRFEHLPAGRYAAHLVRAGTPPIRYEVDVPGVARWRLPLPYENPGTIPPLVTADLAGTVAPPVGWPVGRHPVEGFEVVFVPSRDSDPLSGAVERRARTDSTGGFEVEDLVHGTYDLFVLPPWAVDGDWPRLCEESRRHDDTDRPVTLRLRSGAVDVRLATTDGEPVRAAMVQAWPVERSDRVWPIATTDEAGRVSLEHLPPGEYVVRAHAGEHAKERRVTVSIGQRAKLELRALDRPDAEADAGRDD